MPGPGDLAGAGRDDAVGMAQLHKTVHSDVTVAEAFHKIRVDHTDLFCVMDLLYQISNVHNGSVKQKNNLTIRLYSFFQPFIVFYGRNDRGFRQQFFCSFHRLILSQNTAKNKKRGQNDSLDTFYSLTREYYTKHPERCQEFLRILTKKDESFRWISVCGGMEKSPWIFGNPWAFITAGSLCRG